MLSSPGVFQRSAHWIFLYYHLSNIFPWYCYTLIFLHCTVILVLFTFSAYFFLNIYNVKALILYKERSIRKSKQLKPVLQTQRYLHRDEPRRLRHEKAKRLVTTSYWIRKTDRWSTEVRISELKVALVTLLSFSSLNLIENFINMLVSRHAFIVKWTSKTNNNSNISKPFHFVVKIFKI